MKHLIRVLLLSVLLFHSLHSSAKYVQTCKVKYKANYGWSDYYKVEVSFYKGTELNTATRTFDYDGYSVYAVIFWGEGKATVIKVSSYISCGYEVSGDCINRQYSNLEGEDQEGRGWEICTRSTCY